MATPSSGAYSPISSPCTSRAPTTRFISVLLENPDLSPEDLTHGPGRRGAGCRASPAGRWQGECIIVGRTGASLFSNLRRAASVRHGPQAGISRRVRTFDRDPLREQEARCSWSTSEESVLSCRFGCEEQEYVDVLERWKETLLLTPRTRRGRKHQEAVYPLAKLEDSTTKTA